MQGTGLALLLSTLTFAVDGGLDEEYHIDTGVEEISMVFAVVGLLGAMLLGMIVIRAMAEEKPEPRRIPVKVRDRRRPR